MKIILSCLLLFCSNIFQPSNAQGECDFAEFQAALAEKFAASTSCYDCEALESEFAEATGNVNVPELLKLYAVPVNACIKGLGDLMKEIIKSKDKYAKEIETFTSKCGTLAAACPDALTPVLNSLKESPEELATCLGECDKSKMDTTTAINSLTNAFTGIQKYMCGSAPYTKEFEKFLNDEKVRQFKATFLEMKALAKVIQVEFGAEKKTVTGCVKTVLDPKLKAVKTFKCPKN